MSKQKIQSSVSRLTPWARPGPPRREPLASLVAGLIAIGIGGCVIVVLLCGLLDLPLGGLEPVLLVEVEAVDPSKAVPLKQFYTMPSHILMFVCLAGMVVAAVGIASVEKARNDAPPTTSYHGMIACGVAFSLLAIWMFVLFLIMPT